MKPSSEPMRRYLVRFFLKQSTIEFYFDSMLDFNNYYKGLKETREVIGYEFIRRPNPKDTLKAV